MISDSARDDPQAACGAAEGKGAVDVYSISAAGGTIASGTGVKQSDLTKQFNESIKSSAVPLQTLGAFGIVVMGPETTMSENGNRPILNAPFFDLTTGTVARQDNIGQAEHIRLANIDYEGQYK